MRGQRLKAVTAITQAQKSADRVGGEMIVVGKAGLLGAQTRLKGEVFTHLPTALGIEGNNAGIDVEIIVIALHEGENGRP